MEDYFLVRVQVLNEVDEVDLALNEPSQPAD